MPTYQHQSADKTLAVYSKASSGMKDNMKLEEVESSSSSSSFCTCSCLDHAYRFAHDETCSAGCDGSHDWSHILRVKKNALEIASSENLDDGRKRLVQVIALLHDLPDTKYAGAEERAKRLEEFLVAQVEQKNLSVEASKVVRFVLERMSFKDESKGSCLGVELPVELKVVQDADRLDAIGAVGIARCFMFGGSRNGSLIEWKKDPVAGVTNEDGIVYKSCVGHFYEKLLKLKGMMKTRRGTELAEDRHKVMLDFLSQIQEECRVDW